MRPLALYVHWPFCRRICPYCDFNVRRWRNQDTELIARALLADLKQEAIWRGTDWQLEAIHFGGGTPSMMPPELIRQVIACARDLFPVAKNLEIALEANPEDVAGFAALAAAGVERLTLGVQALEAARLELLGRGHTPEQAVQAIETARDLFPSVAVDMIYATPHQSMMQWHEELSRVASLDIDHLSLYGLTIEPGTAFGHRPPSGLPDHVLDAELMLLSREVAVGKGLEHYEVSNFARPGHRSRYNSLVWQAGDYIGIGPGAHGRHHVPEQRYGVRKLPDPKAWQEAVTAQGGILHPLKALESFEILHDHAAIQEWLLMGLRLTEGIDLAALPGFLPVSKRCLIQELQRYQRNHSDVWVCEAGFFRITESAALQLDYWLGELCLYIEDACITW